MKKALLIAAGLACLQTAKAQVSITGTTLTYTQDFNSLDAAATTASTNLPNGWSIYEWGTSANADNKYKSDNGGSNAGETWSYGTGTATDRALGSLLSGSLKPRYGVKFQNNTGVTITGFTISYTGEQWRIGNTAQHQDTLAFMYSTTATAVSDTPTMFTVNSTLSFLSPVQTAAVAGALDGNATANRTAKSGIVTVNIPAGGTIVLVWQDKDGPSSDDGLAVDDLSITFTTGAPPAVNYRPTIVSLTPNNGATNVATASNLSITFDRGIDTGSGYIHIRNRTMGTTQDIASIPANVSISGKTATINGVTLAAGNMYHVTFDSTAFDTAMYKSYGLYDTTAWVFSTVMPVVTVTTLNENFEAACANSTLPSGWQKFSVTGNQQWNCNTSGGNASLQINGYANLMNNENEDWLTTPRIQPAAATTLLRFALWKRFAGPELQVLSSTNWDGMSSPANATWTPLTVSPAFAATDTAVWKDFSHTMATPAGNFHIAFKYTSTTSAAYQLRLDSVTLLQYSNGFQNTAHSSLPVTVLGQPSSDNISVAFTTEKAGSLQLSVTDLSGRVIVQYPVAVGSGAQRLTVSGMSLPAGLYLVRLGNGEVFGVAKAVVR